MIRNRRKLLKGVVISAKMQKTVIVQIGRTLKHPKYKKMIRRFSKFKVHDENSVAKVGDKVEIMETRPISKDKCWLLVKVLNKAQKEAEVKD